MTMAHRVFDDNSNVIESHTFAANHDDTDGIDPGANDDYVRRSVYHWYDIADRPTTAANYGSGNGVSSADTWKYNAPKARSSTAPTASTDYELVTIYTYHDSSTSTDIDDSGRLLAVKDPEGIFTRFLYDRLGRRTYVVERYTDFQSPTTGIGGGTDNDQDRVTKWEYNGLDNVTKLTAYNGSSSATQVTEYLFTNTIDASWPTLVKYPDGSTSGSDNVQYAYHVDGTINTRTDQRGTVLEFGYDELRRPQAQKVNTLGGADGTVLAITRGYDNVGRVQKITSHGNATTDPNNTTDVKNQIVYTYNDLHQVTKSEQSHSGVVGVGTLSVQYGYDHTAVSSVFDDGARLESVTYPNGRVVFHTHGTAGGVDDQLNRRKEIRKTSATGTILTEYQWTAASRLAHTDYGVTAGQPDVRNSFHANDSDDDYEAYDRFGRVKYTDWYRYSGTVTSLDKYLYSYDRAGNRKTRDLDSTAVSGAPTNRDQAYIYDQLYRVKNFDEGTLSGGSIASPVYEQDYTLEQLGNWSKFDEKSSGSYTLKQARTHNSVNEIDNDNDHSNAVTDSIKLQTGGVGANWIDPKYDAAGNLIEGPKPAAETTKHKYDYDPWNRLAKVRDSGGTILVAFAYDGLNRRITKVDLPGGKTYDYYHNEQWQVIEVRRNADDQPLEQFVWHPYYIDALAVRFYDANTNGSILEHYYGHDANFNVTVVFDVGGAVQERYAYTPYGELTMMNASFSTISSSAIANSYTYTGREYDVETGLYHYRNRYYHAQLGRFLNRDPIGYWDGDLNLYGYVGGSPMGFVDPFGYFRAFGQEWVMPWDENASWDLGDNAAAYGKAVGQMVSGTASGAVAGAGSGAAVGGGVGAALGLGVGSGPGFAGGVIIGGSAGGIGGGINGFVGSIFAEDSWDAAKTGGVGGLASGVTGGVLGPVGGTLVGTAVPNGVSVGVSGGGQISLAVSTTTITQGTVTAGTLVGSTLTGAVYCQGPEGQDPNVNPEGPQGPKQDGDFLDQLQEAKEAFRRDKDFRRWWHRNYKGDQGMSGGGQKNPDLPEEEILNGYLEWLDMGKPKG
jgi:RHS repeat-associated protein